MARMTIVRTNNDNKSWLVNSEDGSVFEIENEAIAEEASSALDADKMIAVDVRAHAASHAYFTT
jgi:hypothetical protein